MKKCLIPLIVVMLAGYGCSSKTPTPKGPAAAMVPLLNNPTAQITPPSAASGNNSNLTLTLPDPGNSVMVYLYFTVSQNNPASMSVMIGPNGPYKSGNSSGPGYKAPLEYAAPATITISATLTGGGFTSFNNYPENVQQTDGWDCTVWSDGNGNSAIVSAVDRGSVQ